MGNIWNIAKSIKNSSFANNNNTIYPSKNIYSNRYWKTLVAFPNDSSNFFNCKNLNMSLQDIDNQISSVYISNMSNMYNNCQKLTGSPIQTYYAKDMSNAYRNCINISGNPYCSNYTTDMDYAYYNCTSLQDSPVCGINVISMNYTYQNCISFTNYPVCGNNVKTFIGSYSGCSNLRGCPVCGEKVTDMSNAYYGCAGLVGAPVCGNNVIIMKNTYKGCKNLSGNMYCNYADNKNANNINLYGCLAGHDGNNYRINIIVPKGYAYDNALYNYQSSYGCIMGSPIKWTDMVNGYYNNSSDYNIYVYNNGIASFHSYNNNKKIVISSIPSIKGAYIYNGNLQTASFSNYDSTILTIGGTYQASDAGTYIITFTPKKGYCWEDKSTSTKSITWTISKKSLTIPTLESNSYTYDNSQKTVIINNYNSTYENQSGTISATTIGSYTVTWSLKSASNTQWSDGTTTNKSASWSITKMAGSVNLSATSGSVNKGSSITFTVSGATGTLSVSSSDTNIATCSISGTTVTVNGITSGSNAIITVKVAETDIYAAATATYSVYVNYVWIRYQIAYNWDKYNCNQSVDSYSQSTSSRQVTQTEFLQVITVGPNTYMSNYMWLSTGFGFNSTTGKYYPTGNQTQMNSSVTENYYIDDYPYASPMNGSNWVGDVVYYVVLGTTAAYQPWYVDASGSRGLYFVITDSNYAGKVHTIYTYTSYANYTYSQGSYVSSVGSTNSSALPNNDRYSEDGYWYVYTGTYNSGIVVDTVASSSSTTYEKDGITGSYWCVLQ